MTPQGLATTTAIHKPLFGAPLNRYSTQECRAEAPLALPKQDANPVYKALFFFTLRLAGMKQRSEHELTCSNIANHHESPCEM